MATFEQIRAQMAQGRTDPRPQPDNIDDETIERFGKMVRANDATLHAYGDLRTALLGQSAIDETKITFSSEGADLVPGESLERDSLIRGVGLGISTQSSRSAPGEPVVRLYTSGSMTTDEAVGHASAIYGVNSLNAERAGVQAVETGFIDAYAHRNRWRPTCPGGISVGHFNITAGTLGAYCVGRSGERAKYDLILSNNHVLADVNSASLGDDILQFGAADGGNQPQDVIALLEDYVTISFAAPNLVDAATGWVDNSFVDRRFVYVHHGAANFFSCQLPTAQATTGLQVGKTGRTTGLTAGFVTAVGVTIRVNMGRGQVAQFVDQIEIQGTRGDFSRGGDSGSLIWTWDETRRPVGLLFAGGNRSTFANPIDTVLNALDIDLML